eukprot:258486-Pelagomonas_calceolata.AAC.1
MPSSVDQLAPPDVFGLQAYAHSQLSPKIHTSKATTEPVGLGQQTVEAITARYPTLPSLWSAYHQALSAPGGNKDGARMLLARLPHVNGLGSVSEAKSAIVYDTLFEGGS